MSLLVFITACVMQLWLIRNQIEVYQPERLPVQEVWGYQPCLWKIVLVGAGAVCSGGLLLLLLYWLPEWAVKGTCTPTSLKEAHTLLLRTTVGEP